MWENTIFIVCRWGCCCYRYYLHLFISWHRIVILVKQWFYCNVLDPLEMWLIGFYCQLNKIHVIPKLLWLRNCNLSFTLKLQHYNSFYGLFLFKLTLFVFCMLLCMFQLCFFFARMLFKTVLTLEVVFWFSSSLPESRRMLPSSSLLEYDCPLVWRRKVKMDLSKWPTNTRCSGKTWFCLFHSLGAKVWTRR